MFVTACETPGMYERGPVGILNWTLAGKLACCEFGSKGRRKEKRKDNVSV